MAVVDASVIVEFLRTGDPKPDLDDRLSAEEHALWAPHLLDAEVGHALRREVRLERMDAVAAEVALGRLNDLPLRRIEHDSLIHFAWDLRENFSFYDALYVALALVLDEPLLTFDARLARSGVDLPIEVLA
jgi:predicted nucleic acid-binding protein